MGFHAQHLQRILTRSCAYYHRWRTHGSLAMDGPEPRAVLSADRGRVLAVPEVGGLHHQDERVAAEPCEFSMH
jgi:hypothetical protein